MNIFNFLPKRIDLTKYYDSLPEELIENIFLDKDEKIWISSSFYNQ